MELYFLRHGLAGQHGDPRYKDDSLRPLTAEGKKKMERIGLGMRRSGIKFDAVLSSPFLRAKQTAEIVAAVYGRRPKAIHLTENLLPPACVEELLKEAHTLFPKAESPLLVGHEPHLSQMISALLQSGRHLSIDFKKGGLCCVSIDGWSSKSATLNWLLTPAQLALMAREKQ